MAERFQGARASEPREPRTAKGSRRGKFLLLAAAAAAIGVSALGAVPAASQTTYPQCGSLRPTSGNGDLPMSDASLWNCGGDLVPLDSGAKNGGAAIDSTFSSSHEAVPEECPTSGNACGRGEFGYGGGELPFGSTLLDNVDGTTAGDHFACANSQTSGGTSAVVSGTITTSSSGGSNPALLFHAGIFSGGTNDSNAAASGDSQCYDPYVSGTSAAMGGASENGNAYQTECISYASCSTGHGFAASVIYIPETGTTTPSSGSNCGGHIVVAGGWDGSNDTTSAALYDPRAEINSGTSPNNSNFNTWSSLSPATGFNSTMTTSRDSALVIQIGPERWLIAGGEHQLSAQGGASPTNTYEIFDGANCGFLPVASAHMNSTHYDAGGAKFADDKVLICGGDHDFISFAGTTSCDLFTPNNSNNTTGGTWAGSPPSLNSARVGHFGQFLPGTVTSTNANGYILMAGGDQESGTGTFPNDADSEECSETACGLNITGWDNYCSNNTVTGCHSGSTQNDLGFTPDANDGGIADSSHVLIGYYPAETTSCSVGGDSACPITLPDATANSTWDGLVLECGGFAPGSNSTGNDTLIACEYYVPSGVSIPSAFLISGSTYHCGNNTPTNAKGPAWCTTVGSHLNRERAYFNLTEVPGTTFYSSGHADPFISCGGFYGQDNTNFHHYVVRKNCEWLSKGTT